MEWTNAINNAINYMEDHLTDDISLSDIAQSVHISRFHFQRAFHIMTGMTPSDYMRKRRLSIAGSVLSKGNAKVIDIALKYGYDSPESFSKVFSRFHGITPQQAKKGGALKFFNKLSLKIIIEGGSTMNYIIETWGEMDLLVYTKEVPGYLGVCAHQKTEGDTFLYGIGCKASDVDKIPEGFELLHIPAYSWVIFSCVGPSPDAIQKTWEKIYSEWLPTTSYEIIQDYDIENYLPGDPNSADYVSEICLPIKQGN